MTNHGWAATLCIVVVINAGVIAALIKRNSTNEAVALERQAKAVRAARDAANDNAWFSCEQVHQKDAEERAKHAADAAAQMALSPEEQARKYWNVMFGIGCANKKGVAVLDFNLEQVCVKQSAVLEIKVE